MTTTITDWQRPWIARMAACLALLGSGCTTTWGTLGAASEDEGGSEGSTGDEPGGGQTSGAETGESTGGDEPPVVCDIDVGVSAPRRMVAVQYENTVADVLGVSPEDWETDILPPSESGAGPFELPLSETELTQELYELAAAAVAEAVDPASLLPCDPTTPDPDACAEEAVTSLGLRLWRRPLSPAEVESLLQVYEGTDLVEGTRMLVEVLLASPNMRTLQETGTPWAGDPGVLVLDAWSLATRMSFFLWNSAPDQALLAQAESGALLDPAVRYDEVERMLADPRAERMLGQLYRDWLDVELRLDAKDPAVFPEYDPELIAAMEHEVGLFTSDVVLGGDPRLHTLLNAPFTYVDARLLELYGSDVVDPPGPPAPGEFVRVDLDPARRGGVTTLTGVMTQHSFYRDMPWTARGLLVREELLCQDVPPPPPDVEIPPPPPTPPEGRYETWQAAVGDPACAACHVIFDPLNFAFDEYDPLGRFQTDIAGEPVQTAGDLLDLNDGTTVSFSGRAELTQILPTLPATTECAVRQHLRFALRRDLAEADQCAVEQLAEQVEATDGNLRVLMRSLVVGEHFTLVRPQ